MIRVFLFIILSVVFFPLQAFSQQVEDYFAQDLLVSQKYGSNDKLKEYFSGVNLKSDTIYAVFFIPGSTPRLEIQLNSFDNDLKRFCPDAETVLVSVNTEEVAAKEYNRRHAYKADHYMYDSWSGYLDFLSFNTESLMGSYVMKIDMKGGRLICGGALYTNEDEFFEALVSVRQPKPFFTYGKDVNEENVFALPSDVRRAFLNYSDVEIENDVKLFQNALDFSSVKIRDCIVPRTEIIALPEEGTTLDDLKNTFVSTGYSKILIYRDTIDNIIGYFHAANIFKQPDNWRELLLKMPIVPETMAANKLMDIFMQEKKSIAVVVDEFGGTAGIVTLEDIMEEIFGEIEDEHDNREYTAKQINEHEYVLSGRLEIDAANSQFELGIPESDNYITVAGYILYHYQKFPKLNETIRIDNFTFKVLAAHNNRIDLVKLTK